MTQLIIELTNLIFTNIIIFPSYLSVLQTKISVLYVDRKKLVNIYNILRVSIVLWLLFVILLLIYEYM